MASRAFLSYLAPPLFFSLVFLLEPNSFIRGELIIEPYRGVRVMEGIIFFSLISSAIITYFEREEPQLVLVKNSVRAGLYFFLAMLISLSAKIFQNEWDPSATNVLGSQVAQNAVPSLGTWFLYLPIGLFLGVSLPMQNVSVSNFRSSEEKNSTYGFQRTASHSHFFKGMLVGTGMGLIFVVLILIGRGSVLTNILAIFLGTLVGVIIGLQEEDGKESIALVASWTSLVLFGLPFLFLVFLLSFLYSDVSAILPVYFLEMTPLLIIPVGQGVLSWVVSKYLRGSPITSSAEFDADIELRYFALSLVFLGFLLIPLAFLNYAKNGGELFFGSYTYMQILLLCVLNTLLLAFIHGLLRDFNIMHILRFVIAVALFWLSFLTATQMASLVAGNIYFIQRNPYRSSALGFIFSLWPASIVVIITGVFVFLPLGWIIGERISFTNPNTNTTPFFFRFFSDRLLTTKQQQYISNQFVVEFLLGVLVALADLFCLIIVGGLRVSFLVLTFLLWLFLGIFQERRRVIDLVLALRLILSYVGSIFLSVMIVLLFAGMGNGISWVLIVGRILIITVVFLGFSLLFGIPPYFSGLFLRFLFKRWTKSHGGKHLGEKDEGPTMLKDYDV